MCLIRQVTLENKVRIFFYQSPTLIPPYFGHLTRCTKYRNIILFAILCNHKVSQNLQFFCSFYRRRARYFAILAVLLAILGVSCAILCVFRARYYKGHLRYYFFAILLRCFLMFFDSNTYFVHLKCNLGITK